MRLVLDTNIYISGFINRYGNPGRLLASLFAANVRAARKPVAERFKFEIE